MNRNWVILSLLLLLIGTIGLGTVYFEKNRQAKETASYKMRYQQENEEFFALYKKWCLLSPYEQRKVRVNFRQGTNATTQAELEKEQYARLKASLPELAWKVKQPPLLADLLYGDNWQTEVEKYRKKQRTLSNVETTSIVFIVSSLIVAIGYSCKRMAWRFTWTQKLFEKFRADVKCQEQTETEEDTASPEQEDGDDLLVASHQRASSDYNIDIGAPVKGSKNKTDTQKLQKTLGIQATNFDDHVSQFSKTGQKQEMITSMATEPVSNSLNELTQEVSAIREFAAQQQDRVRQYQEGYEWTIIKRFCLRIIRCVDHIEERIYQAGQEGTSIEHLEDARDELLFALESSGVDQFAPEIDSDYRGQEKLAEAIREKEKTDDNALSGKIARIVRYGYEYSLSDENVKVVRTAQVKLYS